MTVPIPPTLRLLPAPTADPPYDDEVPRSAAVSGALALDFPCPAAAATPLRLVPPAAAPAPAADPGPARLWARRLVYAIVEVFAGVRTAGQLGPFATLDVLERLERACGRFAGPGRCALPRPNMVSLHVCEPRPGVAETAAVVDTGGRRRALALRLEARDGRWRCTALEIG